MTDPIAPARLRELADAVKRNMDEHDGCLALTDVEGDLVAAALRAAAEEIEQRDRSFDVRWRADMRAIKRWQQANPGNDLVWPDHADLCVWLMDSRHTERGKLSAATRKLEAAQATLAAREALLVRVAAVMEPVAGFLQAHADWQTSAELRAYWSERAEHFRTLAAEIAAALGGQTDE